MSIICRFGQTMGRFWEWLSPENGKAQSEMQYPYVEKPGSARWMYDSFFLLQYWFICRSRYGNHYWLTAEYIDCVANGDLSGNLEVKSVIREVTTLIRASAALKDKLNSIVTEVDGHAMQLDNNMESLNVLASASSKGANQIRQAIDELSKTAVSLAENVQSVNIQYDGNGEQCDCNPFRDGDIE